MEPLTNTVVPRKRRVITNGTAQGSDGSDADGDLEMINSLNTVPDVEDKLDSPPSARPHGPYRNQMLADMLTRQNVVISELRKSARQLQQEQKQTVSTADEVASQLKMAVAEMRGMQAHTGQTVQMAGSCVEEQAAQIEQLADVAKSQYGMSTATLQNQNASVEELRMHREAIRLLGEKQRNISSTQ